MMTQWASWGSQAGIPQALAGEDIFVDNLQEVDRKLFTTTAVKAISSGIVFFLLSNSACSDPQ